MKNYTLLIAILTLVSKGDTSSYDFSINSTSSGGFPITMGGDEYTSVLPDSNAAYSTFYIYNDVDVNNDNTTTFNDATISNTGSGRVSIGDNNTSVGVNTYAGEGAGSVSGSGSSSGSIGLGGGSDGFSGGFSSGGAWYQAQ